MAAWSIDKEHIEAIFNLCAEDNRCNKKRYAKE
jgi:hypothetical protein